MGREVSGLASRGRTVTASEDLSIPVGRVGVRLAQLQLCLLNGDQALAPLQRAWTAEAGRRGRHLGATLLGAAGKGRLGGTGELAGRAWHAKKGLANKSNKRVEQHWHKVEGLPALFDCTLCGWSTA